jgi:hypothetical protein
LLGDSDCFPVDANGRAMYGYISGGKGSGRGVIDLLVSFVRFKE